MKRHYGFPLLVSLLGGSLAAAAPSPCCTTCGCKVIGPGHTACACAAACTCGPGHRLDGPAGENAQIRLMAAMMDGMETLAWAGSPERDFLARMIPHHAAAVAMAKQQVAAGKDAAMVQLAKSILAGQGEEIRVMETLLARQAAAALPRDEAFAAAMAKAMDDMMTATPADAALLADPDRAFAAVMLPHHRAAIAMALAVLDREPSAAARVLAEKIIAGQQAEVRQMQEFLESQPSP